MFVHDFMKWGTGGGKRWKAEVSVDKLQAAPPPPSEDKGVELNWA